MGIPISERATNEFCLCGCGGRISKNSRTGYKKAHWTKTPEGRKKLSEIHKGKVISEEQRSKISKMLRGRTFSADAIRKLSETKRGSLNPNWKGGRSLDPYSRDWWFIRDEIRKRDGGRCLLGKDHSISPWKHADIHHIDGNQKNSNPSNLISLCRSCHSKAEKNPKENVDIFHSILSELYGYQY